MRLPVRNYLLPTVYQFQFVLQMGNHSSHSESIDSNSNSTTKPPAASSCPIMHKKSSSSPPTTPAVPNTPTTAEGCPVKSKTNNAYKNPNQYNVSEITQYL